MIQDRNGQCCSRANRWRSSRDAHMAAHWFLWFWFIACVTHTPDFRTLSIQCKCCTMVEWSQFITFASSRVQWCGSLWIHVFKWSTSNPKGLPEQGVSLMSKRSPLKQENHFLAMLSPITLSHTWCKCIWLPLLLSPLYWTQREEYVGNIPFLHMALHFLASMAPLTNFKWQNFNM